MSNSLLDLLARGVGEKPGYFEDEAYLSGYFQCFRPTGAGLKQALQGLEQADEICERLSTIYAASAQDFEPTDMYFLIKSPPAISIGRQTDLVQAHLDAMREIAEYVENEEVPELLAKTELVAVERPHLTQAPAVEDTELAIYEMITDELIAPARSDTPQIRHVMREAFYTIAAEPYLAYYAQWPWFRKVVELVDPFQPFFELWKNGIHIRYATATQLHFFQICE